MANTKAIGVAFLDQNIVGADYVGADTVYAISELGYSNTSSHVVTQATSKSTAVTLNAPTGRITMNGAALNATTNVTFTLNNSALHGNDVIVLAVSGGATAGAYNCWTSSLTAGSCTITLRNISANPLSEAVVINFVILHCD